MAERRKAWPDKWGRGEGYSPRPFSRLAWGPRFFSDGRSGPDVHDGERYFDPTYLLSMTYEDELTGSLPSGGRLVIHEHQGCCWFHHHTPDDHIPAISDELLAEVWAHMDDEGNWIDR